MSRRQTDQDYQDQQARLNKDEENYYYGHDQNSADAIFSYDNTPQPATQNTDAEPTTKNAACRF